MRELCDSFVIFERKTNARTGLASNDMNEQSNFFKTSGGGQFFQKIGDNLKVICLYDFNPCIERMKFTPDILQSLKCVPCTEDEFSDAEQRAIFLLGIAVSGVQPMPSSRMANAA